MAEQTTPIGWDAQKYLQQNPDVLAASKTVNMSPEQYALWHYQNFGMTEGRQDPLAAATAGITQSRTANTAAPVVQPGNSALLPSDQFNWLARAGGMGASPTAFDLTGGNTGFYKNATYNASPLMQRYLTPQMSNQANPGQPLGQPPLPTGANLGMSQPAPTQSGNPYTQTPGFNQATYNAYANNPAFHAQMAAAMGQQPSYQQSIQSAIRTGFGGTTPIPGIDSILNGVTFDPSYWNPNTTDQRLRMHGTPSGPGLTRPGMSARPVNPFLVRN